MMEAEKKVVFLHRAALILQEVSELTEDIAKVQDENRLRMELARKLLESVNPEGKCIDCDSPCEKSSVSCASCK